MHNIILIERDPSSYSSWPSLIKMNRIPDLSVKEIVTKYQGFQGELISFFNFKDNKNEYKKEIKELSELKELNNCLILHVISYPEIMPDSLKENAIKAGYDVGVCDEEKTVYSSIFNEVIFGYFDELITYKNLLNKNLLFPSRSIAKEYVKLHNQMSSEGKHVEDYEEMTIYEVWRHKD